MLALAGSLYQLSTFLFAGMAGVIGVRLMRLARTSGQRPEWLLGLGLQLTACWGYGVMIASIVVRQRMGALEHPVGMAITGLGWVAHNIGVMCMLGFVVLVFRQKETWSRVLAAVMATLLWVGWILFAMQGGLIDATPKGAYWIAFAANGTYPLWISVESFSYWRKMRRRQTLGLAEPLLVDRFRVWGISSLSAAAAIWSTNLPVWLDQPVGAIDASPVTTFSMLVTAAFGIFTVCGYWLTFFPPTWYRLRIERAAAAAS
jgi:hypothetical protein